VRSPEATIPQCYPTDFSDRHSIPGQGERRGWGAGERGRIFALTPPAPHPPCSLSPFPAPW